MRVVFETVGAKDTGEGYAREKVVVKLLLKKRRRKKCRRYLKTEEKSRSGEWGPSVTMATISKATI